jgi:serine/threonine protein kinase
MHLKKFFHRDIKNDNLVLRGRKSGTEFVDFGHSAFGSGAVARKGNQIFMAPESLIGQFSFA